MRAILLLLLALSLVTIPATSADDTDGAEERTVYLYGRDDAWTVKTTAADGWRVQFPEVSGVACWSTDPNVGYPSTAVTHVYADTIWNPDDPAPDGLHLSAVYHPYVIEYRQTDEQEEDGDVVGEAALIAATGALGAFAAVYWYRRR